MDAEKRQPGNIRLPEFTTQRDEIRWTSKATRNADRDSADEDPSEQRRLKKPQQPKQEKTLPPKQSPEPKRRRGRFESR